MKITPILFVLTALPLQANTLSEADIVRIHKNAITIDTHVDIPEDFASETFDALSNNRPLSQVDIQRMQAGGLDAAFFIVYTSQGPLQAHGYSQALAGAFDKFSDIRRMTDVQYSEDIALALNSTDIRQFHKENKRIALIGVENGYPIGENINLLDVFFNYGARYFGLVHNGHNQLADSAQPRAELGDEATKHNGISELGKQVVERCNELGIMVDVSHASEKSTLDMIDASVAPVIASHSSAFTKRNHPRNLSDKALQALAVKGGVVQTVAFDSYLNPVAEQKSQAIKSMRLELGLETREKLSNADPDTWLIHQARMADIHQKWPRSSVSDLVDHIDYLVELIGIEHVGISSDFHGGGGVEGWDSAAQSLNISRELLARGYSEQQVKLIWGENLLRVMQTVEQVASSWPTN
ncbi:MAG: membrane dipeptidase [Proteobacteria bacterium]|jgi:membrane dipeptidase|nr:membrane dipeptidase [Pseudomonadota bacterium]